MGFVSSIIVVDDIMRSKKLYVDILKLEVQEDHGIYNVGFCGLAMYKKTLFQDLTGNIDILTKSNNFVLYFEVDNIDELEQEIAANSFEFVHRIREQPWGQRVFRFYDYDNHILEIAEDMDIVIRRLYKEHQSIEAVSRITGLPVEKIVVSAK